MNRAQCERATALFGTLDDCDRNIAVAKKSTTITISLNHTETDGLTKNGLVVVIPAGPDIRGYDRNVHDAVMALLKNLRDSVVLELANLDVGVAA